MCGHVARLDKTRRESGYWADFENVRREIMAIATSEADLHANGQEARQRSEDSAHDPWQDASLPESGYEGGLASCQIFRRFARIQCAQVPADILMVAQTCC